MHLNRFLHTDHYRQSYKPITEGNYVRATGRYNEKVTLFHKLIQASPFIYSKILKNDAYH